MGLSWFLLSENQWWVLEAPYAHVEESLHVFFDGDKALRKIPDTTVEVVTTVSITILLLVSALGLLVMGRCCFWGRRGYSTGGLGQLRDLGTAVSPRSRAVWWITSALTSPQHTLTSSDVVLEFTGIGVEKWKGTHASLQPFNFVFLLTPFQLYLWEGSGCGHLLCPEICNTEISQDRLLIFFLFFPARQLPPFSKMLFTCGHDQAAPLPVATKPAGCSGVCCIPNRLLTCHETGCHCLPDQNVQIQLGAFSKLPVLHE